MADIAQLGFAVDTAGLKDGKASLDTLVPAADRAEKAAAKLSSTINKVDESAGKIGGNMNNAISGIDRFSKSTIAANDNVGKMAKGVALNSTTIRELMVVSRELAAGNMTRLFGSLSILIPQLVNASHGGLTFSNVLGGIASQFGIVQTKINPLLGAVGEMAVADNQAATAARDVIATLAARGEAAVIAADAELALALKSKELAIGTDAVTAADLRVTAAHEAVAVAAGEATIADAALADANVAVGETGEAAAGVMITALSPLVVILLGIAAVVGVFAAAFGVGAHEINESNKDIVSGLGLTDAQLKKVKKSGVDTTVTLGDTFKAFFQVLGERAKPAFDVLSKAWNATIDFIAKYGLIGIKLIIGGFVGAVYAIKAGWALLPAAIGDIVIMAANKVVSAITWMVNKAIAGINWLADQANSILPESLQIGKIGDVSLGEIPNPFAGAAEKAGTAISEGFAKGKKESDAAVDRFFADVGKRAIANRQKLIRDAAGDPAKGKKEKKGPKTDAEKFESIVTGAENDIAKQKARADAVQLSAEAAATLEEKTKLLNEAQTKGITLTDGMRARIDELAAAYGKAKVAADNAIAMRDIMKTAEGDMAGLRTQAELIGLVGRQLAYATEMQKLLNEARAKGLTIDAETEAKFAGKSTKVADLSQSNEHDKFMDDQNKAAQERMIALEQERSYIGKSADEVRRLRIENELLAQARQKNIDLTPADIAAIGQITKEQADAEIALEKSREAMEFARGTIKGFFTDLTDGLRQGKSLWESFGNAVVNALNKIIDRLLDKALEKGLDALFNMIGSMGGDGGGSGGGGAGDLFKIIGGIFKKSALGNVYDRGPTAYAKGGTFTNSIVDRPTMFASGGAFGLMGEAGPEAIVPLKRGNDGSLGVQMHGGDNGNTHINAPVTINNDNRVTGAVSSADIVAMQRASAERTKQQISREIPAIIQQYRRDGAIV